jgi:hypothetical protein
MAVTQRVKAYNAVEKLTTDFNYSHKEILEYLINNFLSGKDAKDSIEAFVDEQELARFFDELKEK